MPVVSLRVLKVFGLLIVVFSSMVLVSCFMPVNPVQKLPPIVWPKPPDSPRFMYETTLRSAASIDRGNSERALRNAILGIKDDRIVMKKPYDVAARGGKIVVTDTVSRAALMFDVRRGKLYPFGIRGEGVLKKPMGVAMDEKQMIYIADITERNVKVYDHLGLFVRHIGSSELFDRPVDVAVSASGDKVYVVDSGGIDSDRHRVMVFDAEGEVLREIGFRGKADGEFNLPIQAAVNAEGELFVVDSGNFRVQVFDAEGTFLRKWGYAGRDLGSFSRPRGIAVDSDSNVYVTDANFRNFQIFNREGRLLMFVGEDQLDDKPGHFILPAGITVDETNRIYVVDQMLHKVEVIKPVDLVAGDVDKPQQSQQDAELGEQPKLPQVEAGGGG